MDVPGKAEAQHSGILEQTQFNAKWLQLIKEVIDTGCYNYQSARIPVNTDWNFQLLHSLLTDYHDKQVIQFLQYGWPVDRDPDTPLEMGGVNHKGATDHQQHVDKYISKEMDKGAVIGPFEAIPFKDVPVAISPISTRAKKDSDDRRIIMDCSWPIGASLNDGLEKDRYLGQPIHLKYPTVDLLARRVYELHRLEGGKLIYFFKEDLDRAFRQLMADPSSIPLLGYRWRGLYYFDLVMVMGCRVAPYICQRTTDMISYIHRLLHYFVLNYVDDFIGCEQEDKIWQSHAAFIRLLQQIGVSRSQKKSVPPTQEIDFVGTLFNARDYTMGITQVRKTELLQELNKWRFKIDTTRHELEVLVGKLQFVSNCVRPGRLRRGVKYVLNPQARKDIMWWYNFIPEFEGTCVMWLLEVNKVDAEIAVDACLVGVGGISKNSYYRVEFPKCFRSKLGLQITHLELWAVILAIRAWGHSCTGKIITVKSDNEAVATIINTGRSQDMYLQQQLRELCWWLSKFQMKVRSVHLVGKFNRLPDLLSRWGEGLQVRQEFEERTSNMELKRMWINNNWFQFAHTW